MHSCPFRTGLNQLWRNMLLAEQVAKARECHEFRFWVFSPDQNEKYLWKNGKIERDFRETLNEFGNSCFRLISLGRIMEIIQQIELNEEDEKWLELLLEKYDIR